ncbi:hypothetical protein BCT54_25150 [Vibrio splendidus]|uniref:Uncharacterized protein n=1 Tax=Vibrio splendidus TaxID=29497 RepID=A0A2N7JPH1_VIBSP|nr:hypothetical protein BCT54_25150 [Vibrio splendidus]
MTDVMISLNTDIAEKPRFLAGFDERMGPTMEFIACIRGRSEANFSLNDKASNTSLSFIIG